ncbi:recombinase family protein [Heyndrickxia sp. FSL W8-0423]|uniref:recombinase family protein n=1 Tax=Heyndrickxia sp. FSL W8-0423 TaxID=2921601 RepID=UPI0030FB6B68
MIIGYARVSSSDQSLSRQIKELEEYGCEKIFTEKQSGKNFVDRKIYQNLREKLRFGDVLVVHDLSRFGRNKQEIKDEWESLIKDGIDIVVLNMPILDTTKYKDLQGVGQLISDLTLSLLSWMVDEERQRIKIAQKQGIEIAKKQGKYKGRKRKYHSNAKGKDKIIYEEIIKEIVEGTSIMDIHRRTGVARSTIYKIKQDL